MNQNYDYSIIEYLILIVNLQIKEYVKKYATAENFDGLIQKKAGSPETNGVHKHNEDDGEGSELSQTSDIEDMCDDEDGDIAIGEDEEEK